MTKGMPIGHQPHAKEPASPSLGGIRELHTVRDTGLRDTGHCMRYVIMAHPVVADHGPGCHPG